jgi:hypothetical protein
MSDSAIVSRRRPDATFIAAGLVSSLLYISIIFSFVFLLPLQVAFGRKGGRSGMAAVGISALGIALVQGWRLVAAGAFSPSALAVGILPPLVLLAALALINAPIGQAWPAIYRILGVTLLCALAALPVFISIERDASITAYLEDGIAGLLKPLQSAVASASDGYEASALAASLDPKDLVASSIALLRNSYGAMLFLLLAGSWRLGNRLSGLGSRGRERTGAIDDLRLPYPFLWAFLVSWTMVLAAVLIKAPTAVSAVIWNCALTVSLAFAAQGLGIVTHLFKKWNMPKSLRILMAVMAVISFVTPLGIAVAALLPFLGVTEIWIHYRKPKGVGA